MVGLLPWENLVSESLAVGFKQPEAPRVDFDLKPLALPRHSRKPGRRTLSDAQCVIQLWRLEASLVDHGPRLKQGRATDRGLLLVERAPHGPAVDPWLDERKPADTAAMRCDQPGYLRNRQQTEYDAQEV